MSALCILALASCGQSSPSGYAGSPESSTDTLKPIVAPPGANDAPPKPGTTGAAKTADGLPALTAKGPNTALFSQPMKDEVARLDRLENAVQELRTDFDTMAPAIVRLVAIEKDIQNLISQLEVLTGNAPPPPVEPIDQAELEDFEPQQPAPAQAQAQAQADPEEKAAETPANPEIPQPPPFAQETAAAPAGTSTPTEEPAPPPPVAQAPPAAAATAAPTPLQPANHNGPSVVAMRVGEHPGKVRIVLDVKGKTSYTADLDNKEKILVVELPKTAWSAESQKSFTGNPLLSSYRTEALSDGGTMLILQLKSTASIGYQSVIDSPDGRSRIVIDLTL